MVRSSDVSQAESLKQSTRHETVNSTSRNDEKSRPPGEQHSEHSKRSFNKILTRKTRTGSKNTINNVTPRTRRAPHPLEVV
uniref:Ovule protein n=1 Tax=Bursaphelenchus xylophilus TaxID=6326 RepID=A0A1I7RVB8_BURXY